MGYLLTNRAGEFFAYRRSDWAMIFTDRVALAREYKSRRGARIAATGYKNRYGYPLTPFRRVGKAERGDA